MADFFDEKGEKVEGLMTKEEHEAAAKAAADAAAAAAIEKYKQENPAPAQVSADEPPPWFKPFAEKVNALDTTVKGSSIESLAMRFAGNDPAKQAEYKNAFEKINRSAYPDTAEGAQDHAKAVAKLAFGTDVPAVDVGGIAHSGAGRSIDNDGKPVATEGDKTVRSVLGIKQEDVDKFAPKGEYQGEIKKD